MQTIKVLHPFPKRQVSDWLSYSKVASKNYDGSSLITPILLDPDIIFVSGLGTDKATRSPFLIFDLLKVIFQSNQMTSYAS